MFLALRAAACFTAVGDWERAGDLLGQCATIDVQEGVIRLFVAAGSARFACHRGAVEDAARWADLAWEGLGPDEPSQWLLLRCDARTACAHVAALRGDHAGVRAMLDPLLAAPGLETDAMFWEAVEIAAWAEGDLATAAGEPTTEADWPRSGQRPPHYRAAARI